jgi:hypothetical protein
MNSHTNTGFTYACKAKTACCLINQTFQLKSLFPRKSAAYLPCQHLTFKKYQFCLDLILVLLKCR